MDLLKLSKKELLKKCEELGFTKYKSKNKNVLIELIKTNIDKKESIQNTNIDIQNICGMKYLENIKNDSIDLILTDPPYNITK